MNDKLEISDEVKSLATKMRERTATAEEKARFKVLMDEFTAKLPKPPNPRDIYVTDKNGILVLDKQGRPIPK